MIHYLGATLNSVGLNLSDFSTPLSLTSGTGINFELRSPTRGINASVESGRSWDLIQVMPKHIHSLISWSDRVS